MGASRRGIRWLGVVVAVVALTAWIGAAALLDHVGDPGCQVCKLLQHGAADVGRPAPLAAAPEARPIALPISSEPLLPTLPALHPGRAPPLT